MNILINLLAVFAIFLGLQCAVFGDIHGDIFTNCGGIYEAPKGVLYTPNFPGPYPTPIYCEWLIHAPPGKKIVLYFTQNYMKDSIYISSYDYYQDIDLYVGREDLGQIFWEHDLTFLVKYKPYVLLQFSVESIANRHLRVTDHLLDVYGFNITYEFVDNRENLSKQTCSVRTCSYLGNCLVSANFSDYSCHCFDKFFGDNCQYGPYCDPENGVNQCSNGGVCKYFFGSLINQCECPDGFEGAYCERATGEALNPAVTPEECAALKCSHQCDIDFTGQARCYCPDGYSMTGDNETCIPVDRYRFDVSLEFERVIKIPNATEVEIIKNKIGSTLKANSIQTVSNIEIHGFRNTTKTTIMEFHFYCFVSEVNAIKDALKAIVDLGDVAGFELKQILPKYDKNPELMLSEVMNYDPHPTLRGKMLTLVCAAKGSSKMRFRWYKDNVRVDTSLTLRNAWETIVPHTIHGMLLSVLNIDSVMPIDQGMFTCQVEDFGTAVVGNVAVTVNNYPRVQLDPMSLSVSKSRNIAFKCLSPDDSWQQFTYEWFKDGIKISANSEDEYAEDMYPTGVRLVVTEVKEKAEYTCKVTNEAGPANVSAYVFVIKDNSTVQFCPRNYYGEVMWSNTSGGHFDVKRCPTEQGGYARRHCDCDVTSRNCKWAEPNFSKCQSLQLIHTYDEIQLIVLIRQQAIKQEKQMEISLSSVKKELRKEAKYNDLHSFIMLELLRNGYQQTNLSNIFDDLHTFILSKNENAILYSGDMDMVAGILKELISHMKTFPQLVERDQKKIDAKRLVDLMGAILLRSSMATADEKSEIMVGPSVVQTVHDLVTGAIEELKFSLPLKVSSSDFDMREEYLIEVPCSTCDKEYAVKLKKDAIGSNLKVKTYAIRSQYLADLLSYRDVINNKDARLEFVPVSAVVSVAHINEDITSFRNPTARVVINHNTDVHVSRSNTTICLKWQFEIRNSYSGKWTQDGCITAESHLSRTVCECRLPGHFISGMVPSNVSGISQTSLVKKISLPLVSSYCVSLVCVLVAFFIYTKTYSHLNVEIHTVHFSFIISIVCSTVVRIVCLSFVTASQTVSDLLGGALTFTYYVALTALILEMFHLFVITYNIKLIMMTRLKFVVLCWGIPFLLMIPTILVSKFLDIEEPYSCHALCWLYMNTSQFLVFVLILGLNFSIYILLLILCICSLRKWTEEWRYAERRTYVKSIAKNSILLIFLLLTMCSGCILVLVIRCILNKHIRYLCVRMCCGTPRRESSSKDQVESKSFRAFMEPKNVGNVVISQEEDNVSKYYDEVNRTKYTKERKKMLTSLLGSGSGSGSGSGGSTAETSVNYNSSSDGSKESTSTSVLMDLFSHSGTDCGILINGHSKGSSSSVGASGSVKDEIQSSHDIEESKTDLEKQNRDKVEHLEYKKSESNIAAKAKKKHINPKLDVHSSALNQLPVTNIDHDLDLCVQTHRDETLKKKSLSEISLSESQHNQIKENRRSHFNAEGLTHSKENGNERLQEEINGKSGKCRENDIDDLDEQSSLLTQTVDSGDQEDVESSCN